MEKESLGFNELKHVRIEKVEQLFLDMLQEDGVFVLSRDPRKHLPLPTRSGRAIDVAHGRLIRRFGRCHYSPFCVGHIERGVLVISARNAAMSSPVFRVCSAACAAVAKNFKILVSHAND
jgi:hypothetical protein